MSSNPDTIHEQARVLHNKKDYINLRKLIERTDDPTLKDVLLRLNEFELRQMATAQQGIETNTLTLEEAYKKLDKFGHPEVKAYSRQLSVKLAAQKAPEQVQGRSSEKVIATSEGSTTALSPKLAAQKALEQVQGRSSEKVIATSERSTTALSPNANSPLSKPVLEAIQSHSFDLRTAIKNGPKDSWRDSNQRIQFKIDGHRATALNNPHNIDGFSILECQNNTFMGYVLMKDGQRRKLRGEFVQGEKHEDDTINVTIEGNSSNREPIHLRLGLLITLSDIPKWSEDKQLPRELQYFLLDQRFLQPNSLESDKPYRDFSASEKKKLSPVVRFIEDKKYEKARQQLRKVKHPVTERIYNLLRQPLLEQLQAKDDSEGGGSLRCPECRGQGSTYQKCRDCNGRGGRQRWVKYGNGRTELENTNDCSSCGGQGFFMVSCAECFNGLVTHKAYFLRYQDIGFNETVGLKSVTRSVSLSFLPEKVFGIIAALTFICVGYGFSQPLHIIALYGIGGWYVGNRGGFYGALTVLVFLLGFHLLVTFVLQYFGLSFG